MAKPASVESTELTSDAILAAKLLTGFCGEERDEIKRELVAWRVAMRQRHALADAAHALPDRVQRQSRC